MHDRDGVRFARRADDVRRDGAGFRWLRKVFIDAYQKRMAELQKTENAAALEKELREVRRRVGNITQAISEMGASVALREKLSALETQAHDVETRIAAARERLVLPHPAAVAAELHDLLSLMAKDVPRARQALGRLTAQPFRMVPTDDGYHIEGGLRLGLSAPAGHAQAPGGAVLTGSCSGGKI